LVKDRPRSLADRTWIFYREEEPKGCQEAATPSQHTTTARREAQRKLRHLQQVRDTHTQQEGGPWLHHPAERGPTITTSQQEEHIHPGGSTSNKRESTKKAVHPTQELI
jgi:hypothetical protein